METKIDSGNCPKCGNGSFRVAGYGALWDARFIWRKGGRIVYAVCAQCSAKVQARDVYTAGRWYDRWTLWSGGDHDQWPPAKILTKAPHYMVSPKSVEHDMITIGEGHSQILEVSTDLIRFQDKEGTGRHITLARYRDQRPCNVGSRALDGGWCMPSEPPYWVMIAGDDRYVQFVFQSYEEGYEHLLIPLRECGYRTFDQT